MGDDLRVFLLAYPDNPVGKVFINTFLKSNISVKGIIVERKKAKTNWKRMKKKVHKDGMVMAVKRSCQVLLLKIIKQNIVDIAKKHDIDVFWVEKFNSKACEHLLSSLDIDLLAIVSAPILKEYIFSKAKYGCPNAHPGWLPKYRGLGGNAYALQNGDSPGVTVHFIDAGIDTGKIITREKLPIEPGDTIAKINDRAMVRGAKLMSEAIHKIQGDRLIMPLIDEPVGEMYFAMPYSAVTRLNKRLRKNQFVAN